MRKITLLIIHCSATPEGKDYTVEDIDRWHKARGWKGIGYHYVIYRDGSVHAGRPEADVGAHCQNHNQHSLGICYIGGLRYTNTSNSSNKGTLVPADTRTPAQKTALMQLLKRLKQKYSDASSNQDRSGESLPLILGHNVFANKACPCFDAATEYRDL